MIAAGLLDEVLQTARGLIMRLSSPGAYRGLLLRAIAEVRRSAKRSQTFLPIDLPFAAASALSRPRREARIAAAACTLLWAGADLMDDHTDDDLPPCWRNTPLAQLALVWTNLLATFPHLLVTEMGRPECLATFHREASRALWRMSDGQFTDVSGGEMVRTARDYLHLVRLKTGAETALFASCPAILSGAPARVVRRWAKFGEVYGCMAQTYSDTISALAMSRHNDLLRGKRSLPVLHAVEVLSGRARAAFTKDLASAACGDMSAAKRAIEQMSALGAVRAALAYVEVLRHRAAAALPAKLSELEIGHPIRRLMWSFSVI